MEEKMFELMTKMYSDMTARFDTIDKNINEVKNDVVRLENKFDDNSKALFDGYNQTYEEVKEVKRMVEDLSNKVEKQEVEIKVIKGGK